MRLSDIGGEFGFIDRIRRTHSGGSGGDLAVPIGDDAAVLDVPPGCQIVVTTDLLVEGIHFRRDWCDPYSVGWKAAAVNLSDIAAMGADPTFAFLSLALSAQDTVEGLDRLYAGFTDCLSRDGARLAGGDTNATLDGLVLNVTQLGTVPTGRALTRAGAQVSDILLVTGTLGDSAGGLALLSRYGALEAERLSSVLVDRHRRPQPRVAAGLAARETGRVHAAMDLSDGLAGDVQKLCAESGVGAKIDARSLPLSDALRSFSGEGGVSAWSLALSGGEDFELLLAVAPSDMAAVQAAVAETGTALSLVGEIVPDGFSVTTPDGATIPLRGGWDHFTA